MNNFKSGSGNLDFGESDEDEESETNDTISQSQDEGSEDAQSAPSEQSTSTSPDSASSSKESATSGSSEKDYPYFVRRSNVGDERDTRLEIHVRDKVADQEAKFRTELAEHLGANEVSKTDAREFALLAAFHHPERVAELMQNEGFGTLG